MQKHSLVYENRLLREALAKTSDMLKASLKQRDIVAVFDQCRENNKLLGVLANE